MKNKIISFASIIIILCFFNVVFAQIDPGFLVESIGNFHSDITVNIDNSISVVETITYNTGPQERHGIYRDIYPYSSIDNKMAIEDVDVTDENNNPYIFETSNYNGGFRIKIGDPDQTFSGQKTYVVKYKATKAIAQFKDFDEIYWNVTGNEWPMPIYKASASVTLPTGINALQSSCYYGPKGSTNKCALSNNNNNIYTFNLPTSLNSGEGFTIAVGFPKGIVAAYTNSDKASNFLDKYLGWIIAIILPILTLIFSLLYWYKKGRDPKGTGVIVPQYDVPDGLSPMEVAGIVNEKIDTKNISAEIVYLATMGYIKINQLEKRFLGIFEETDYELIKLKDFSDLPNEFDKELLTALFRSESRFTSPNIIKALLTNTPKTTASQSLAQSVKLSDLRNVFFEDANIIITLASSNLLEKGYYKNLGRMKINGYKISFIIFISIWVSGFLGGFIGYFTGNPLPLIISIFISIIIFSTIFHFSPAKTVKGVAIKEYLLGLKDYLQIAEKDRLIFHNAPDKKPEIFEKLLPYAMVLGVADIWAKEFEGIYTTPPTWYAGPNNTAFNSTTFNHSMSNFSSSASSSLSSTPGGSGGGGSSGGGGGGGGGGGW